MIKTFHNFKELRVINDSDLKQLKNLYRSIETEHCHEDYNLHFVEKKSVGNGNQNHPIIKKINQYMIDNEGLGPHVHYFLRYNPWSWTRMHQDNKGTVTKTLITFIETSDDLVGGDTIVYDRHYDLPPPEGHTVKRTRSIHKENVVPVVANHKAGASVLYSWNVSHGVSMVRRGHRIVLVSWFVPLKRK